MMLLIGSAGWEDTEGAGETSLHRPWISPGGEEQGQRRFPERYVYNSLKCSLVRFLWFDSYFMNLYKELLIISFPQETTH